MKNRIEEVEVGRTATGNYGEYARFLLEELAAAAIVVVVVNGKKGSGICVVGDDAELAPIALAQILQGVADGIKIDPDYGGAPYHAAG